MINYSIIIPHKNTPQLLERCLASIPEREDVQVIVVDDSSDGSIVDFAHFPGAGRANTEVIFHRAPIGGVGGPGVARNVGLGVARGKWIVFADADDFFHSAISDVMDAWAESDADMVFFRHDSIDSDTGEPVSINTARLRHLSHFDRTGDDEALRYLVSVPWGRFIRRSMVEEHAIRFDEVRFSASVVFCLKVGYFARVITSDSTIAYCNTRREGSLTREGRRDWEAMMIRFDVDHRAAALARVAHKGELLESTVLERWRELSRLNRRRAKGLLPRLREVCDRGDIFKVRLEETLLGRIFGK